MRLHPEIPSGSVFKRKCHLFFFNFFSQVRTTALAFLKRMYEKDQLRDYIEKFALNYLQLLVHPNPPSLLFGADKDTGLPSACTQQPSLKLGVWPL